MSNQTTIIRSSSGWKFINFREIARYRDLLYFLVVRGIKAKYAQSVLGIGWAIIQPLVSTLIFTVVFGSLAKISSDGVPYFIFSLTAMVPWTYFSNTLTESANSLVSNANLITKVYFPRMVLPLSAALSKLLDFVIAFGLLLILLVIYGFGFSWMILVLPLLIAILLITSLGLGMLLAAMAVQYRDVKHALNFVVQLLMYLAPVVYPASNVPVQYQFWYALNPMVGVIEGFRSVFLHHQPMPWNFVVSGTLVGILIFVSGALYFRKMEKNFADVA
ncbi:MAG: ABC transporter permease [Cyclobacteriaceae bacterium]|nr:ABC transporter permease [Cyclobacteriaceae bacterium]